MQRQITAVIVGAGNRSGKVYGSLALSKPERLKIVGLVDPDPVRMRLMQERYHVPQERCFSSVEELVKQDKFADVVINGTMDELHVQTSLPTLEKGYDLLLEKPFAVNEEEMQLLVDAANRLGRKVYICHVLRYSPFYAAIKSSILQGDIGDIITIELNEHVSYHHMGVSYVRGKWRSEKLCHAPMLLAKSCHDIDLMMWLVRQKPVQLASFGGEFQFGPGKKPAGAGSRCMADCPHSRQCPFTAEGNYLTDPTRWAQYVWKSLEGEGELTPERQRESLMTDNPYGRCAWDFERDGNVDHQAVLVRFESGATGTFTMVGGAARPERNIHIIGTRGEIKGVFEDQKYVLRRIAPFAPLGYEEEVIDLGNQGDTTGAQGGHGGGDLRLVEDFLDAMCGEEASVSATEINDSTVSHRVVFRAMRAMVEGTVETID